MTTRLLKLLTMATVLSLAGCQAATRAPEKCGDGTLQLEEGEECDDGENNSDTEPDACRENCKNPFCGDSVTDSGEQCDDGGDNSNVTPDACRSSCLLPHCGDGVEDSGEECDDNNMLSGDGCSSDCKIEGGPECGDGNQDAGEECDDGANNSDTQPDACRTNCRLAHCGDDVEDTGEECDDGNTTDGDGCSATCTIEIPPECGDGNLDPGEECDDGVNNSDTQPDACRTNCRLPSCGDGVVDTADECDDVNLMNGDGCDDNCLVEPGWICSGSPSVCVIDCTDDDGDGYGDGTGCLGPDCNDNDGAVNPGETETCNSVDDNCDGGTDEGADQACYDGPAGTAGEGICQDGTSHCVDGSPGPCLGQVVPVPEACNLLDDDCDGSTDEDTVILSCGVGECYRTTPSCDNGVTQQCVPGGPTNEICDGLDNNCDGSIDEVCGCVYVAPFGDDNDTGGQGDPMRTIIAAIARAATSGSPNQVCVGTNGGCGWTLYSENVVMQDGISVQGGFDSNNWTRSCLHRTAIRPPAQVGLYFGPGVVNPATIAGFELEADMNAGNTSAAVTVDGSTGAVITNNIILGSLNTANETTYGVHVVNGATPLLYDNAIQGGLGFIMRIGLYSQNSAPIIRKHCSNSDLDSEGRCTGGCGPLAWGGLHIMSHRPTWPNPMPPTQQGYAVLLENSPGAFLDQNEMCGFGESEGAGVKVVGDATGTVISRNGAGGWGGQVNAGVFFNSCEGASPWVGDNDRLWAEGSISGAGIAEGIRSMGDCHPLIEVNQEIAGGYEGGSAITAGIHCGVDYITGVRSQCTIIGNVRIQGSAGGFPVSSTGIKCSDGSCSLIRDNALISGRGGVDVRGIYLDRSTSVMVDKNVIQGGCGTQLVTAVLAEDAGGRFENNVIWGGGDCGVGSIPQDFYGLLIRSADSSNELDVHSNIVNGGGIAGPGCVSHGIALDVVTGGQPPSGPRGILRNNILDAGTCSTAITIDELSLDADPRFVENNDLLWPNVSTALYRDETATDLHSATAVDALPDTTAGGNIDQDPGLTSNPWQFGNLPAGSPCEDTGTSVGAPTEDFEYDSRPLGGGYDIGPDEIVP